MTGAVEVWHVYVLAFVFGVGSAFDAPARTSFVSEMVEPDELSNAVGLNSASFNAARMAGPALAGLLIAAFGGGVAATGWVIILNGLSYVAVLAALQAMDVSRLNLPPREERHKGMVRDAVRYLRGRPDLMMVLGVVFFTGTFGLNFQMTSALMATQVFHKGATEYGLLGSVMAVGSLTGALMAARRTRIRLRLVVGAALAFSVVEIGAGLAPTYLAFAAIVPLLGFTALTMITAANTTMQLATAPGLRGRVMALYLMVFMGGTPLGSPFIGWIGERVRRPLDADRRWRPDHARRARLRGVVHPRHRGAPAARDRGPETVGGAARPAPRLGGMNPRYRRLVIPVALGGLILIVVVAALVK